MTVRLVDLTIRYGRTLAVDHVTAEFPPGAVGLLGRNGAGKSSILKALLGLVRPEAGSMQILDLPVGASPLEIRRLVGYMPERDCHVPGLSGYETVRLAAQLSGLSRADAARRAHEVLYLVELEEQRYRPVAGYSAGMRQKVKLAVALVHDPAVLFLDEPTNGLDPGGRRDMLQLIATLATGLGKSVVLSSHILQDVEATCAHVVLLERGHLAAAGLVRDLTRTPTRVFELEAAGDQERLHAALRAAGVTSIDATTPPILRLLVPEEFAPARIFGAVQECDGVVRRLVEHRRTLEEVFLGAVAATTARVG